VHPRKRTMPRALPPPPAWRVVSPSQTVQAWTVTETKAQDADTDLYACAEDSPREARLRRLLVRLFATTSAFMDQPACEFPHLAADVAMRIVGPALEMVAAEAEASVRTVKAAVADSAEETLTQRLTVIEAAARASERAACVQQLRAEGAHLAAVALAARGPDAAVAARDAAVMAAAARSLAQSPAAR